MVELGWFKRRIAPGSLEAYLIAALCVALAAAVRWAIGLFVPDVVPFATFFAATLMSALVGGKGPGLFAALTGCALGWWAFLMPTMAWLPLTAGQQLSIAAYLVTSGIIVGAVHRYQHVVRRLEEEEKFRQLAVEELAHRLKNKVATIQSIVSVRLR
jgi:K+-sensing histidine kinase KdpD